MKLRRLIIVGLLLALGGFCFVGRHVETYRDKYVSAGQIHSPFYAIAIHVSKPQYLTINGKTYRGVRGLKPYYLEVPQLNSILFVTEGEGYRVTFHVVNMETKNAVAISGGTSGFGWDIGSQSKPGEIGSEYIETVQSNKITLAKRSNAWKETTVLNLDTREIEREDVYNYDANGIVTNHLESTNAEVWK